MADHRSTHEKLDSLVVGGHIHATIEGRRWLRRRGASERAHDDEEQGDSEGGGLADMTVMQSWPIDRRIRLKRC